MRVLFCRPRAPQRRLDRFELELDALEILGVESAWLDFEDVVDGRLDQLPEDLGPILLRSWMLTGDEYRELEQAVAERGGELITGAAAYEAAHYLPNYHGAIEPWAAPTRWIEGTDLDEAWEAACELGPPPYLIKDHVKSSDDPGASLVPAGASRADFERICTALIDERGDRFARGLVFRAMLPLVPLGPGSGARPIFEEYRLFFWRGELVSASAYDEVAGDQTDFSRFAGLGDRIDSPFFSVDVAPLITGGWAVIEVGDGGVSTLPPLASPVELYRAILEAEGVS